MGSVLRKTIRFKKDICFSEIRIFDAILESELFSYSAAAPICLHVWKNPAIKTTPRSDHFLLRTLIF